MHALSAKDICEIIKACKNSTVKKIKFGELELELGVEITSASTYEQTQQPDMKFEVIKNELSEIDRLSELMQSNPLQYEEEIKKFEEAS